VNASDWTGIAATITATGSLIAAIRNHTQITTAQDQVEKVHQLVNSHATAQEVRVDQLASALTAGGIDVPPRPPQPPPEAT